jgi:hypothetical protein
VTRRKCTFNYFTLKFLLCLGCNGPLIQKGNNEISDVKLTSPDPKSNPEYARMDSGKAWCTSAKPGKYLEVITISPTWAICQTLAA